MSLDPPKLMHVDQVYPRSHDSILSNNGWANNMAPDAPKGATKGTPQLIFESPVLKQGMLLYTSKTGR